MLNRDTLLDSFSYISDGYLVSAEALLAQEEESVNTKKHTKILRVVLLAAAIATLMVGTAYAAGWINPEAVIDWGYMAETKERVLSVNKPESIPEELDPAIAEKLRAQQAASEEWLRDNRAYWDDIPLYPEVFVTPEGAGYERREAHDDGSATLYFYDREGGTLLETREATAEDCAQELRHLAYVRQGYGAYAALYGVRDQAGEERLEALAAQYGLRLCRWERFLGEVDLAAADWVNPTGRPSPRSVPPEQAASARLILRLFDDPSPATLLYDGGAFYASGTQAVPGEDKTVSFQAGYTPYDVLLPGSVSVLTEPGLTLVSRTHIAPDGTELTILRGGVHGFVYAFLPNAYFCQYFRGAEELTDAELDALADRLDYGALGKSEDASP